MKVNQVVLNLPFKYVKGIINASCYNYEGKNLSLLRVQQIQKSGKSFSRITNTVRKLSPDPQLTLPFGKSKNFMYRILNRPVHLLFSFETMHFQKCLVV